MRCKAAWLLTTVVLPTTAVLGHGSMKDPVSRVYSIYLEGPGSPDTEAAQAAVEHCGTQAFYDWNELVNFFPGNSDFQSNVPYAQFIPDGRLASADNDKYDCLDEIRSDWPATPVQAGPRELIWYATTPHNPSVFRAWITTEDWNSSEPLNWDQMVELELGPVSLVGLEYRFETVLPERSGRHALYVVWQRIDPVGEGFYSVCDVIFGADDSEPIGACCIDEGCRLVSESVCNAEGGDYSGSGSLCADAACDGGLQGPDSVVIELESEWESGYQARMTITNSMGDLPMLDWSLTYAQGPEVTSIWNAVLEEDTGGFLVRNESWNGYLDPGSSVNFSFVASGTWPPSFVDAELNGMHVHIDGAGGDHGGSHDDCPADLDGDARVGVDDLLAVLSAWGSMNHSIDVDGDMLVGVEELLHVVGAWGDCG